MRYKDLKELSDVGLVGSNANWHNLPKEVYKSVKKEKLTLLRTLHDRISTDAKLPMPPVRVEPFGWVSPDGMSVVFGKTEWFALKDGSYFIGVLMPVSTLVAVEDQVLLRRILCHEFSHCFWYLQKLFQEGEAVDPALYELSSQEQWERQVKEDKDQLARPEVWFGETDVSNFLYYEDENGHRDVDSATRNVIKYWIVPCLPTKVPTLGFSVHGKLSIPDEVVERIKQSKQGVLSTRKN